MSFKQINKLWQVIGGGLIAPALITLLIIQFFTDTSLNVYQWLLRLHLPIIMIHEHEEYVFPGGFKEFFNTKTPMSPKILKEDTPLNEPYIFVVNILLAWSWAILGAIFANTLPWIGFSLIIFQMVVNNAQHAVLFHSKDKGYNPGLFTTIVLLMPYCTFVIWYVVEHNILTTSGWILSIICGLSVFFILLSITFTRNKLAKAKLQVN